MIFHGTNVRQRVRGRRHRTDGLVREHVVAETRIRLDPLGVEEWTGGDAQTGIEMMIEELSAGSEWQSANTRQRRNVAVVPRVRPINAIDRLSDGVSLPEPKSRASVIISAI